MATTMNAKTGNRGLLPASTRTQARVTLYQPTQRPTRRPGEWQVTAWGRVRVSGRIGQRHADCVEALCATALDLRVIEDGGVELLVDPHRLRRVLAGGRGQYSSQQLCVLLADLRGAVVEIETPELAKRSERVIGGLVDHWVPSSMEVPDPRTGGTRRLWRVRLGVALVALLRADQAIWRDPAPIAALRSGVSQAVARHVLTHASAPRSGWKLDGLLEAVGVDSSSQAMRNARRRVQQDAAGLEALGIAIDGDRVQRTKSAPQPGRIEMAADVSHPPGAVSYPPGAVSHPPGAVSHPPGGSSS